MGKVQTLLLPPQHARLMTFVKMSQRNAIMSAYRVVPVGVELVGYVRDQIVRRLCTAVRHQHGRDSQKQTCKKVSTPAVMKSAKRLRTERSSCDRMLVADA